jgi:hypothetical protein
VKVLRGLIEAIVTRWFLREDTIKAANAVLVNFHHQLPISRVLGEGIASSSDGQRFGIQQSSLLASYYPRYFGYYERAVTVYTHTSDQYSVFGTRIISCSPREALYVLDGLLENNTILRLREHYTDTHPSTFGTATICGPEEINSFTGEPSARELPLAGSWLITLPVGTVLLVCWVTGPTMSFATVMAVVAAS